MTLAMRQILSLCLCAGAAIGAQRPQRIHFAALTSKVDPVCPEAASKQGMQAAVRLDAIIGKDGHVQSVESIRGNPVLADSARLAVMQWVYRPTLLNGEPIEVVMEVRVPFVCRPSAKPATAPPAKTPGA